MNIFIIGTGYVGLVTGSCLAEMGHNVTCFDIDKEKINLLKKGEPTIFEPGLKEILTHNLRENRISFTTNYSTLSKALVCFICVPTPSCEEKGVDLSAVMKVSENIAKNIKNYCVIVNKSTVPTGTNEKVHSHIKNILNKKNKNITFDVVSNPEFLKEGNAINDFMKPDRIIIGSNKKRAINTMKELYAPFTRNHDRIIVMDPSSAELTKYAANAMLATRISFMNELARICEEFNADINHIRQGIGSDSRIGYDFLYSGIGYGGSCFPKDVKALKHISKTLNIHTPIIEAIEQTNDKQKLIMGEKIKKHFEKTGIKDKTITIWGLSYKPNTDDIREAPSLILIDQLLNEGAKLKLYDPAAMKKTKQALTKQCHNSITWANSAIDAAKQAHAIILITEWKQFRSINLDEVLSVMKGNTFFDGRNQYCPKEMVSKGFNYISIGRPSKYAN